jgi:hypothetical protein
MISVLHPSLHHGVDADVLRTGDCGRKDEDKQKKQTAIAIH